MPVYLLNQHPVFPPPESASPEGIVAVGGSPSPERLIAAYSRGIFPWPHEGMPLLWFSPDPRFVIDLATVKVERSLRKSIRRSPFEIRADTAFVRVMESCAAIPRAGQQGTWITRDMINGYTELHKRGIAHSIEAWLGTELVGGLYGISLGSMFCGESMFATASDASKIAAVTLFGNLKKWAFSFVDCQVYTGHLARFGAEEWDRSLFLYELQRAIRVPTRRGLWQLELGPIEALERLLVRNT
jgi:leucyl/phenylalanyl-tRNA---protein transferase